MLTLSEVSKAFGGRTLFADLSLQINREDRVGLVGPNGCGKSTLFSLVLGTESPDSGLISLPRNFRVGHLPQENVPVGEETVLEVATAISPELVELQGRLRHHPPGGAGHEAPDLHEAQARYDQLGGHRLEATAKSVLNGLGFRDKDFHRPAREMSGGWVMRAHLARLLVQEPDLLLLDEPTNHLDLEALLWFQQYLRHYPGAILVISHDRDFLNQLVTSIVEIRQTRLWRYRGNYDEFLTQRAAHEVQLLAAWKNQQREIARLQLFVDRFRAKNTKASQAQSKLKQIERMEKVEAPVGEEAKIDFEFPQPQRSGLKVITLTGVQHAYGQNVVYSNLNFHAERGQRTVLVGPNGAGKSTLLKLLAGVLPPQSGTRQLGHNTRAGYYSQYRVEMLRPALTVLEEALETPQPVTELFVRTVLGAFLFRGDDVFKPIRVLSGGEKSRLALVKLLLDPPNLLLLDEPTTHLDLASVEALLAALRQFQGTILFISHDVYFIRELANHVVEVKGGRLRHFPGDYQYYLDKTAVENAAAAAWQDRNQAAGALAEQARQETRPSEERKEQKRREAQERQARGVERKAQTQLVHRLEKEIGALEQRQRELTAELERPETYEQSGRAVAVNRELLDVIKKLEELTPAWEAAATRLAEM